MDQKVERFYPSVMGLIIAGGYFLRFGGNSFSWEARDLLSAVVNVSAIGVGFLATVKSILFSIERKRIIKQLKDIGYFDILIGYLMSAINWSFSLAILSALGLLVNPEEPRNWYPAICTAWVFVATTASLSCYRVIHIFSRLLRSSD